MEENRTAPLLSGDSLLEIIPQRAPIVMVDTLYSAGEDCAETGLLINPDNIFVQDGKMQTPGLVEHAAQSAAAFAGWRSRGLGLPPSVGFIGEVKQFSVVRLPEAGTSLRTVVKVAASAGAITLFSVRTEACGSLVASGMLKIFSNGPQ